jgi:hypothetical protein
MESCKLNRKIKKINLSSFLCRVFLEPLDPLALRPFSDPFLPIRQVVLSSSMLLALFPVPDILTAIGPNESTMSVFLVVFVVALINPAISKTYFSLPMHFIMLPFAFVNSVLKPYILT